MFDDFMHNDFPEMHLNQAQQDAMLHAQNQAMNQAMRAQREAARGTAVLKPQAPETISTLDTGNATTGLGMFVQVIVEKLLRGG